MDGTTAGPFLKYGNCDPVSGLWSGSVLYLTKAEGGQESGPRPKMTLLDEEGPKEKKQQFNDPLLLDTILGWSFWRFDFELQLNEGQRAVQYVVEAGGTTSSATFWLQAKGQPFHWGYTSCNGISGSIAEDHYSRKDPTYLWRDMLQVHGAFPLHALVGGGDQVYSDPVWKIELFDKWGSLPRLEDKINAEWTEKHEAAATEFYLKNYLESYTMEHVCTAYASIPSVMIWDDHDIWDGYGSYDAPLQTCTFFQSLFKVAKRFYLLFQQQATEEFARKSGEYIEEAEGFHSVKYMGPQVALLCIDMRMKRAKARILPEVLSFLCFFCFLLCMILCSSLLFVCISCDNTILDVMQYTYQLLRNALLDLPESVQHVVALSGVPVVFPSVGFFCFFFRFYI